jgi:hypothetical protein
MYFEEEAEAAIAAATTIRTITATQEMNLSRSSYQWIK